MLKLCSIKYGSRFHGNNDVPMWPLTGIKPFGEIALFLAGGFVSMLVIDWKSLRKTYR